MPIFTPGDIAQFRQLRAALAYHDAYELRRPTRTQDEGGGEGAPAYTTVATGAGQLAPLGTVGGTEAVRLADRLQWVRSAEFALSIDVDVRKDDRIVINGVPFEIAEEPIKVGVTQIEQSLVVREVE